ncbi:MAG: hypothetical protein AB4038_19835 [Prochloraceae cyanobacterium]
MFLFTTREKLQLQSVPGDNSSEIIFQNKLLTRGPDFAKNVREAAIGFCRSYAGQKHLCLLVENSSYLSVWKEESQTATINKINKSDNQELATSTRIRQLPLDSSFISRCQQELAELIGPIAIVICERTVSENPTIGRTQLVKLLAKEISDREQAQSFQRRLLS